MAGMRRRMLGSRISANKAISEDVMYSTRSCFPERGRGRRGKCSMLAVAKAVSVVCSSNTGLM